MLRGNVFISWWIPNVCLKIGISDSFNFVGTFAWTSQRQMLLCKKLQLLFKKVKDPKDYLSVTEVKVKFNV